MWRRSTTSRLSSRGSRPVLSRLVSTVEPWLRGRREPSCLSSFALPRHNVSHHQSANLADPTTRTVPEGFIYAPVASGPSRADRRLLRRLAAPLGAGRGRSRVSTELLIAGL